MISGPFTNLSSDFKPLVDFIARELQTIEFRDFKLHVIFSMHKRALIRRIGLFLCRGWAQHIVDHWRDAVSPGSPPFASDDVDLLPCDISLDFPFRRPFCAWCISTWHKMHQAQQQPLFTSCFVNSLMPLALPRAGVGKKHIFFPRPPNGAELMA